MKKMLTEKEAWLKIAEHFKQWPPLKNLDGICVYIDNQIPPQLRDQMKAKIPKRRYKCGPHIFYVWSVKTRNGNRARVKFCLEQAEKL